MPETRFRKRLLVELKKELNFFDPELKKNWVDCKSVALKEPRKNKNSCSARIKRSLAFCKTNPEKNEKGYLEIFADEDAVLKILNDTKEILIDQNKKDVQEFKEQLKGKYKKIRIDQNNKDI